MGPREDVVGEIYHGDRGEEEEMEHGLKTPVNSMSLLYFRRQLVVHFFDYVCSQCYEVAMK